MCLATLEISETTHTPSSSQSPRAISIESVLFPVASSCRSTWGIRAPRQNFCDTEVHWYTTSTADRTSIDYSRRTLPGTSAAARIIHMRVLQVLRASADDDVDSYNSSSHLAQLLDIYLRRALLDYLHVILGLMLLIRVNDGTIFVLVCLCSESEFLRTPRCILPLA